MSPVCKRGLPCTLPNDRSQNHSLGSAFHCWTVNRASCEASKGLSRGLTPRCRIFLHSMLGAYATLWPLFVFLSLARYSIDIRARRAYCRKASLRFFPLQAKFDPLSAE